MPARTKVPKSVIVGLVLAILLDTIVQISWKCVVSCVPEKASLCATQICMLSNSRFYLIIVAIVAQLVNWTRVLARADLSFAQPFTALSIISVLAVSSYTLHEKIAPVEIIGITMILLGVYFISQTPHDTTHVP